MHSSRWSPRIFCSVVCLSATALCAADLSPQPWIDPGSAALLPATAEYDDVYGKLGILNSGGALSLKDHPFFTALGTNGRACVSCHQPAYAMSVSAAGLRERWRVTQGKDPVFAAIDGSNCPHLPQEQESSHSLLLERGLFRVSLPWPPKVSAEFDIAEFDIEVVRDPTGCNLHREYGFKSKNPTISVYRRPRPAANLKYVMATNGSNAFIIKNGLPASVDPETGVPQAMNLMSDARWPTLKLQAQDAASAHLQTTVPLSHENLRVIVEFEMQVYAAQVSDKVGGSLLGADTPQSIGPENLGNGKVGVLGDNFRTPVFGFFDKWKGGSGDNDAQRAFRASVARGNDVFFTRPFFIRDAMHINTVGLGNPVKRTCATCHNMQMTGMDLQAGWVDVGTTNSPWANESPELPLFKITCRSDLPPHAFLGRIIYTQDPGRALISAKCNDVGAIVMQQMRGLAARAPYFSNGSARNLRELVDFYDRRFNIRYSEQEKQDLVNFLSGL